MSNAALPDPVLVTRAGQLKQLVEEMASEPILGVDTESNSLFAYQEQVCLIQFSSPKGDYLVDPLALNDLSPLAPVFADPGIEKVFHAAEYDLIGLRRDYGFVFDNLFDTMVAATILGKEEVGLGAILGNEFGVRVQKRYQRANWGQRPLPADLMAYARLDTHYLIELRQRLRAELVESGLWPLAEEDFNRLRTVSERPSEEGQLSCWRISGATDLSPQKLAVLHELCLYRDGLARLLDRPLFKVLGDRSLLAIAEASPTSINELKRAGALSPGQARQHGAELVKAVQKGLQAPPLRIPRTTRPDDSIVYRLENLRHWRKTTASRLGVKSEVVLPRDLLYAIAHQGPRDLDELADILRDVPYRLEHFGGQLLQLLGHR